MYDTAATFSSGPDPSLYRMNAGQVYVSTTIDGVLFEGRSSDTGLLYIYNDTLKSTPPGDLLAVVQDINAPSGWGTASNSVTSQGIGVLDSTKSVFSDESIPSSLNLSDFDLGQISIHMTYITPPGGTQLGDVRIYGDIQTQAVPEPSGLVGLLSAGVVGLAFVARKRAR
jgi:hypothetical protein